MPDDVNPPLISKPFQVLALCFFCACGVAALVSQARWDELGIYAAFAVLVGLPVYLKFRRDSKRQLARLDEGTGETGKSADGHG